MLNDTITVTVTEEHLNKAEKLVPYGINTRQCALAQALSELFPDYDVTCGISTATVLDRMTQETVAQYYISEELQKVPRLFDSGRPGRKELRELLPITGTLTRP